MVVEEVHFGHLQDEEVEELHEEHEEEFADAADLQEDGAGQQAEQHAGREVLRGANTSAFQSRSSRRRFHNGVELRCLLQIVFKTHIDLTQVCVSTLVIESLCTTKPRPKPLLFPFQPAGGSNAQN